MLERVRCLTTLSRRVATTPSLQRGATRNALVLTETLCGRRMSCGENPLAVQGRAVDCPLHARSNYVSTDSALLILYTTKFFQMLHMFQLGHSLLRQFVIPELHLLQLALAHFDVPCIFMFSYATCHIPNHYELNE
jgi:hypothetical protein